jgi:hypothetical protein
MMVGRLGMTSILDVSWLNELGNVIFGHGISRRRRRSGGVKHRHDMPPFRFLPSSTLGDSSTQVRNSEIHYCSLLSARDAFDK